MQLRADIVTTLGAVFRLNSRVRTTTDGHPITFLVANIMLEPGGMLVTV